MSEKWFCLFKCLVQWKQVGGRRNRGTGLQQNFCNFGSKMLHRIVKLTVMDVRFPTSLEQHGSDAMVRSSSKNENLIPKATLFGLFYIKCRCSTLTRIILPRMW